MLNSEKGWKYGKFVYTKYKIPRLKVKNNDTSFFKNKLSADALTLKWLGGGGGGEGCQFGHPPSSFWIFEKCIF